MDEPVKVKYVPLEAVEKLIEEDFCLGEWAKEELYQMAEKYGIDAVRYKNTVSIGDLEMRAIECCADWNDVFDYVKEVVASNLEEAVNKHAKCTDKRYYPETRLTEYRYDIMIGEIPKWQQKGEKDAKKVLKINEEQKDADNND